jgi:hypothetical protein
MNISKHFTKRFRLNFTLNQSSQNAEQHTVHISEIYCYIVKSNNLSTICGMLYNKFIVLPWQHWRKRESAFSVNWSNTNTSCNINVWKIHARGCCRQGRRKHQKIGGGGAPDYRGTSGYWKGHLKKFSRKCWRRGGKKINFPVVPYRNCMFLHERASEFCENKLISA